MTHDGDGRTGAGHERIHTPFHAEYKYSTGGCLASASILTHFLKPVRVSNIHVPEQ